MESYTLYQNQNRNQNCNQNYTRSTRYRDIGIFRLPHHKASHSLILSRLPSHDKTCSQKHTTDSSLLFTRRRRLRLGALVFEAATNADSCHSLRVVYVSERRETLHVSALGGNQSRRRRRRMKRQQKRSERTTPTEKKAPCFKVSTNLPSTGVITNAKAT